MYISPTTHMIEDSDKPSEPSLQEESSNLKDIDIFDAQPVTNPSLTRQRVTGLQGGLRVSKPEDSCQACTSVQYIYHVTFRRCAQCGRESYK